MMEISRSELQDIARREYEEKVIALETEKAIRDSKKPKESLKVVCNRCGGYGVTLFPDLNQAATCGDCLGKGYIVAEPVLWENWKPDPKVEQLISTYDRVPSTYDRDPPSAGP